MPYNIIKNALQISTIEQGLWKTVFNKSCDAYLHGITFTELNAFLEDFQKEDIAPTFKLTDLAFM